MHFVHGSLTETVELVPRADLNILSLAAGKIDLATIRKEASVFETSLLYTLDSGSENALA